MISSSLEHPVAARKLVTRRRSSRFYTLDQVEPVDQEPLVRECLSPAKFHDGFARQKFRPMYAIGNARAGLFGELCPVRDHCVAEVSVLLGRPRQCVEEIGQFARMRRTRDRATQRRGHVRKIV